MKSFVVLVMTVLFFSTMPVVGVTPGANTSVALLSALDVCGAHGYGINADNDILFVCEFLGTPLPPGFSSIGRGPDSDVPSHAGVFPREHPPEA